MKLSMLARAALFVLGLTACGAADAANPPSQPPLIVLSIDGFRADYFNRGETPTLAMLAADGVHARRMRPSFPSVTSPNHYTLMTGLYPDHHGIVDNTMIDPAMPGMSFGGPHGHQADIDPRWWDQATPLWVTAQQHGLKTATSRWPGEEAVIHGVAPSYIQDDPKPRPLIDDLGKQVATVLAWLDLPPQTRPALIRMHFDIVDLMGHVTGPDSVGTNKAITQADTALGSLVQGLKSRGLYDRVNLVVVSDHGMADVSSKRMIYLDDLIDIKTVVVPTIFAAAGVDPLPGHDAEVAKVLLAPHDHMTCWRRHEIPTRLHYGHNPRVPAIFCLAEVGWSVATREAIRRYPPLLGNHGYDNAEATMAALFVAHGPAFRSGVTLPDFDNVDVYPMLARLMGLRPLKNDGAIAPFAKGLRGGGQP